MKLTINQKERELLLGGLRNTIDKMYMFNNIGGFGGSKEQRDAIEKVNKLIIKIKKLSDNS